MHMGANRNVAPGQIGLSRESVQFVSRSNGKGVPKLPYLQRVTMIATYIETHLGEPLRVEGLARVVGQSPSHFYRTFRRWFGVTTREYIRIRRVEAAKQLMILTTKSLSEIAADCGMTDQSHLTHAFRRIVGETPSRWRRSRRDFHNGLPFPCASAGSTL
jgi:AraC-like DNA-binding protein